MTRRKNDMLPYLLLGVAAFMYINYSKQQVVTQTPPIQPGKGNWTKTVADVVNAAGGIFDSLFGKGGPFENLSKKQVSAALEQEGWAGPGSGPGQIDYGNQYV